MWDDLNGDASSSGESGKSGVTVTLYSDAGTVGTFDASDTVLTTATSGADGTYSFTGRTYGNYLLRVTAGTTGFTQKGSTALFLTPLSGNANVTGRDFYFQESDLYISGNVYRDYNGNGAFKRFYNSVMARGDTVIANSEWTANHIRTIYPDTASRLTVIPRGIDLAQFRPEAVTPDRIKKLFESWLMPPGGRIVLLPGRLSRWKGQHLFLDVLKRLANARGYERAKISAARQSQ